MSAAAMEEEKLARLRLNFFACQRSGWLLRLMGIYGGAAELLKRPPQEIAAEGGVSFVTAQRLAAETAAADPEKELELCRKLGVKVLTALDAGYPALLKAIYDPPLALYVLGELSVKPAAAIVGTRKASGYGLRMAAELAGGLASAGAAVASGLARGVDTAAHEAALKSGGATWAALGSGLADIYPSENRKLAARIAEKGGAVISEFPLNTHPSPNNFPRRNRVVSGLSLATVVVEGGFDSGALITARFALDQGREVLAVPGQAGAPMAAGPNSLLKNGAALAEDVDDILACFPQEAAALLKKPGRSAAEKEAERLLKGISPDASSVYGLIAKEDEGLTADDLAQRLDWPPQRAAAALFELEVASLAAIRAGRYCRR
jgi:DNA processing protein